MLRRLSVAPFFLCAALALILVAAGCTSKPAKRPAKPATPTVVPPRPTVPEPEPETPLPPVMLGIDVLEADGFRAIAGKKIGLLTHAAGVNRRGESTIDVLRRARQSKLVALFAPEHGLDGLTKASVNFGDTIHAATGLPVYSVHGKTRKPTKAMLKGIDALVIDLQDIGSRSYTFASAMVYAMAACFEQGVEVIVLDRPNPLGGLKVDGPPLDPEWKSYVGVFRVPYVHGLTIGELARMAKDLPGIMSVPGVTGINVPDKVRIAGKLTVIPMRGWRRSMRWPETGLRWIPTSPLIQSFEATVGYAMVGLGCEQTAWTSGIGTFYQFRGIGYPRKKPDEIIAELRQYNIPGLEFQKIRGVDREGNVMEGVYTEITDWEAWHPTELSFYMQKIAAKWSPANPFAKLTPTAARTFNIHVGSTAWLAALQREGARVDVAAFFSNWRERAAIYQQQSRKYWLYP